MEEHVSRNTKIYLITYGLLFLLTGLMFHMLSLYTSIIGGRSISSPYVTGTFYSLGILSYFFGIRHGFDADHLAAIDNATRKLMQEGKRSRYTGVLFSLGHSTVVILLSLMVIVSIRITENTMPRLEQIGTVVGTLVSAFFLFLLGTLNLFVLREIRRAYRLSVQNAMNDSELENILSKRGFMNRYLGGLFRIIKNEFYMYPIGFLFGLGFDTASETTLLAISAAASGVFNSVPIYTILIFPFLFTTGMVLTDSSDGFFMNSAYGWAFTGSPKKKVWFNLTMTSISITVAYVIGGLETLGLAQQEFNLNGTFWRPIYVINDLAWGNVGLVIVIIFALSWTISYIKYLSAQRSRPCAQEDMCQS
ncbi:HoxN/HupN/NixA family nickel/cobalt transporter [Thermoplasma sp.]|uniref:HoxN/HupN/NixA family nickel/cobalt transporter n=1 Tax=Thermoplasma sp. TaxID=1973142 RepID=UPI001284E756|nr:HoxN/HupN/NixA family nickel/cobalt transporter [Thermoplasma sp.]KAA8921915.1 MAG: HoxN/HupN/NixA family nickel/cobalt transporter [Thermoplasma sp.]